ncbi:unnamed protein product, partial [Mesorhabditis spiculigera]
MSSVRRAKPLNEWLTEATETLQPYLHAEVSVVSLIGRDTFLARKSNELNNALGAKIFDSYASGGGSSIDVYFSLDEGSIFLVLNGFNDLPDLLQMLEGAAGTPLFETIGNAEKRYLQLFTFISVVSHLILFVEQGCRFDVSLARTLKSVNKMRIATTNSILKVLPKNLLKANPELDKEGRFAVPRFAFAFHRNKIRQDLGATKKRELYEKLEENLEQQIYNVFKLLRLIENSHRDNMLGYLPGKAPYAQLLPPETIDHVTESLLILAGDRKETDVEESEFPFLHSLLDAIRAPDEEHIFLRPRLGQFISVAKAILPVILDDDAIQKRKLDGLLNREARFIDSVSEKALEEAIREYEKEEANPRHARAKSATASGKLFTKAEHDKRFARAVSYLKSVAPGDAKPLIDKLQDECAGRWQMGCDVVSLTGLSCELTAHPAAGDLTKDRDEWTLHYSAARHLHTCGCGLHQALRNDPFSLKDANYDFYMENANFKCASTMDMHKFNVLEERDADGELDTGEWTAARPEPRLLIDCRETRSGSQENASEPDELDSVVNSDFSDQEPKAPSLDEGQGAAEETVEQPSVRCDEEATVSREDKKGPRALICSYEERRSNLKARNVEFCDGVPHTLMPGLPLFPSWQLTVVGASNSYSHSYGLRDMPGFRPGTDYLLPYDVYLEVKLFIGFEYECPKGHRNFLGGDLEPVPLAKGTTAKEMIPKDAAEQLLSKVLPIWRPCTCRSTVIGQLMRVHIVTPKAPVQVTIDPHVQVGSPEGHFCTGEGPLELGWAKYYVLRLPYIYSGLDGPVLPPSEVGSFGRFFANSIKVTYTPFSWM